MYQLIIISIPIVVLSAILGIVNSTEKLPAPTAFSGHAVTDAAHQRQDSEISATESVNEFNRSPLSVNVSMNVSANGSAKQLIERCADVGIGGEKNKLDTLLCINYVRAVLETHQLIKAQCSDCRSVKNICVPSQLPQSGSDSAAQILKPLAIFAAQFPDVGHLSAANYTLAALLHAYPCERLG